MTDGIDYLLGKEIEEAIDAGVIDGMYCNFNAPSISELKHRMKVLDEVDVYVVIKALTTYRRELFVRILEYMNEREGEKE